MPSLLAALGAGDADVEAGRIERLIARRHACRTGSTTCATAARGWRRPRSTGDQAASAQRLAAVLREQYLLAPALRDDEAHDAPERRRLEELLWTSH